jgi:hypothetical protein
MEEWMKLTIVLLSVLTITAVTLSAFAQNRALLLDGKSGYVEVSPNPGLDISGELTVEMWFTNDTPENDVFLFMQSGDMISFTRLYGLYITGGSSQVGFYLSLKNSGVREITAIGDFADGRWRHLAGTFDGQIMTLYIDGAKRASMPLERSDEIVAKDYPIQMGAWRGMGTFHSGLIDEVRLWRVARTQEEIRATMNSALTGEEEGLAGYWNFDNSGGGNDAALQDNARIVECSRADKVPLTVVKTIPNSPENVPVDTKEIKFFFSEEMSEGWAVEYLDNLPVEHIAWNDDMRSLTIGMGQALQPGTIYFVILNPTIEPGYIDLTRSPNFFSDTQGDLLEEFFFTFTTEKRGEVDITPPAVTDVIFYRTSKDGTLEEVLSDLSERVPANVTDVKIVFSEKMREKGNRSIRYSDDFPRRNTRWNKGQVNSMTSVTIHFRDPLMPKSEYYIKLNVADKKYMDLAGNLLEPYTITFTTTGDGTLVPEKKCIATTWGAVRKN